MSERATQSLEFAPAALTDQDEAAIRALSVRFEGDLRQAQERLRGVAPSEHLNEASRDIDNKVAIAALLTSTNLLPWRLMELAPNEAYEQVRNWLDDPGRRAGLSQDSLKDLEEAARHMSSAVQIAGQVVTLIARTAASLQDVRRDVRDAVPMLPVGRQYEPGSRRFLRLFPPRMVQVVLIVLAILTFVVARTPTPLGQFLRDFSSWLLG
jgi:hypothetical protein